MHLWSPQDGAGVSINPLNATVYTYKSATLTSAEEKDRRFIAHLLSNTMEGEDFEDENGKGLFKRALKKLGRLNADEMYAFEPALCIGEGQRSIT